MFNDHQDIVETIKDVCEDIFHAGINYEMEDKAYFEYLEYVSELSDKVQQRLEYMRSQIDELMLEYCPDDLSREQLDNYEKNQVASEYDPSGN